MPIRPRSRHALLALILTGALALAVVAGAQRTLEGTIAAPDFPVGVDWLNVERPLTLADLEGKVVLLDFWTYGCINCIHMIPVLKRLEAAYPEELVVIGVHSGKFDNERVTDNIRTSVERYEIEHPVINDADFAVWRTYGVQAWPTFLVIDPLGRVVGSQAGEAPFELFDEVVGRLVATFDPRGQIDRSALPIGPDLEAVARPLRFPGKVLADGAGGRLFISDTNHDRIVVTDLDGTVLEVIGSGEPALVDGGFSEAAFRRPQGLTLLDATTLIVADTENHALRRVDLAARTVETIAGTGEQVYMRFLEARAAEVPLNSPWDVEAVDGTVYIAMAGQHQLYALDPASGVLRLHAGSGREQLTDGPHLEAALNQPSGLASDGELLYFADSEASAIRSAGLDPEGALTTIVGLGLFEFGDVDGVGPQVRLQHPLGVEVVEGALYVADTYNHKVKRLEPSSGEVVTVAGGESDGWRDGPGSEALLDEPGGLSVAEGLIYVADTNNHAVRVFDPEEGTLVTLRLRDPLGLLAPETALLGEVLQLPPVTVAPGRGTLDVEIELPESYILNDLAPLTVSLRSAEGRIRFASSEFAEVVPELPIRFEAEFAEGDDVVRVDLVLYYCRYDSVQLCLIDQVVFEQPVTVASGGADGIALVHRPIELLVPR